MAERGASDQSGVTRFLGPVFTDLVGSTALKGEKRHNQASAIIQEHRKLIRWLPVEGEGKELNPTAPSSSTTQRARSDDSGRPERKACLEIGAAEALFHDFHRTTACSLVRAGVSENVAIAISGHNTRSVFDSYDLRTSAGRAPRQPSNNISQNQRQTEMKGERDLVR